MPTRRRLFMKNEIHVLNQFKFRHEGKANEEAIIQGEKFRFTILTSRLFRLEY